MVVLRAERVLPTSLEAFIIRLYRQENKDGFLKAFSNNAESFASGFSTLQTIMGQLHLRQGAILECLEATLAEIQRSKLTSDIDDFSVERIMHGSYDITIRRQLDPVWHRLKAILISHGPSDESRQRPSQWLMSDAANVIFGEAKARLWSASEDDGTVSLTLEEPPKWKLLLKLLLNFDQQIKAQIAQESQHSVLAHESLSEAMQRKAIRSSTSPNKRRRMRGGMIHSASSRPIVPEVSKSEWDQLSQVSIVENGNVSSQGDAESVKTDNWDSIVNEDGNDYFGMVDQGQLVIIQCYQADEDDSLLQELMPGHVILYDPNAHFVRHIELFRALYGIQDLRIYFLLCTDSVEEQMYLAGLRREKDAFERIIRKKATMAIPLTAEGAPMVEQADDRMIRSLSTRVAGGQRAGHVSQRPTVVVDMREFRSSLPSLLHAAGFVVTPCTLQVGDYVISSDMCIERKTLGDLVQSLNSGRLYTQCEAMSTHYVHPILLIEFDQERAYTLATLGDNKDTHRRFTTPQELSVQAKLVLLTLSFPRLRLVWSSSPYASVEIISDLKQNFDEPDPIRAAAIGLDEALENGSVLETAMNITPTDMLYEMPGVTTKNALYLMREAPHIQALCELSLAQLQQAIGSEAARKLYAFLHQGP
ncbi:unnamed protein product [Malassezia sympodialis ATCC 42132]|uniref:uncharacterized protein n=1 Tax=Malassezia sympodialis (strain ATCC 42132) TaxID=1230383 RepID=UPI0002C2C7A7|nr:uncharacterized protein MSY001_0279 [Malassezia sympodialis ATCC 42132]CCU97573.1 unnamed protein product [Malassezia sympodialis ATCC 42132]|eukprot:XP_018738921.1 uncharacterized protein MSY001_0279 [Malassezia sympodialis ATCC 42132]